MNETSAINKSLLKYLTDRENINSKDVKYVIIPHTIDVFSKGIEGFFPNHILLLTTNLCTLCFVPTNEDQLRIYNYNTSEIIEISLNGKAKNSSKLKFVLQTCLSTLNDNFSYGLTGVLYDDLEKYNFSSLAINLSAILLGLYNTNNVKLTYNNLLDILNNTNEGFLSKNLNIHDLCNFQIHSASNNLIFLNLKNQYRFDNIRIIQISHSNKVKEKTKYLNLKKELEKAYKLLSVFLSSMRLSEISKIDKNNFNSFIKRVPEEQQHLVLYLYQTSVFIKKSATALRSNDLSRFIELLNYSTTTMIQLGLINDQTLYLLEKLKYLNEILGTSISITNGDITCIFSSGDENKIKNHIEGISENLIYKISEINGISIS